MSQVRSFTVLPVLPEPLKDLDLIANNLYWTWNPDQAGLFEHIDSELWKSCGHNPVKVLASVSQEHLDALASNEDFLAEVNRAADKLKDYLSKADWFDRPDVPSKKALTAYFSAEFGIHECLPIYAGGLGILAGDYLKSISDLGINMVGVGLLYQKGYFRQYLNIDGWQQEAYTENDFYMMPVRLVRRDGEALTVSVELAGRRVSAQIWRVNVGRVRLFLLDTNIESNKPEDRTITSSLYGGGRQMRIKQEILLGIGGFRALVAMGMEPNICHMNEGHAAFMALERIRQIRQAEGVSFAEALEATSPGNVFTIHTPVKAGLDEFSVEMVKRYFSGYIEHLGLSEKDFIGLGRVNPSDNNEPFMMPVLALKLSSFRNGVSRLHGQVSRRMWSDLWRHVPPEEIPITSITNGVHLKSWLSEQMNELYERNFAPDWQHGLIDVDRWDAILQIPDEQLWQTHQMAKDELIAMSRKRLKTQMLRRGRYHTELNWADEVLDRDALTIGFARRFASYKRGGLLLNDPQRLVKLLTSDKRPVQIIFAGKAHPADEYGKQIIRQIVNFARKYKVRRRIVFIEDYDISIARTMVAGCDVWLNTPRRPMEASGTSGMKAAINGALNMSTLDGWWAECYKPGRGWAIGAGETYDDTEYQDMVESKALYNILENEVVPLFYNRSDDNLPREWIYRMKNSISSITPLFSAKRMALEYSRRFYKTGTKKWRYFNTESMSRAKALSAWKLYMKQSWKEVQIKQVEVFVRTASGASQQEGEQKVPLAEYQKELKVGTELNVSVLVKLPGLDPDDVTVELYYGDVNSLGAISEAKAERMNYAGTAGGRYHRFTGNTYCKSAGRKGLTVRLLPHHPDLTDPYELGLIYWEGDFTGKARKTEPVGSK